MHTVAKLDSLLKCETSNGKIGDSFCKITAKIGIIAMNIFINNYAYQTNVHSNSTCFRLQPKKIF